ncbi:ATP-binding protein [Corallococcus sp. AB018]|uniref:ATP-binding protein n=1 Tax=Corallococcus sp. AB018 TaxID=2316715 RepID=UPI000F886DC4|nr:ATP-binding protein [Corallococcus sp. AB018]RUO91225.1 ATP-binding protein [Corallococcus sp. AB018]
MAKVARFLVDPRLAVLLGESYRSSEQALKELIDNAWDADATRVEVTLPQMGLTGAPIVIDDDGVGMSEKELRTEYLKVASDRRSRRGEVSQRFRRPIKGRKGVGKFAGLMAATSMVLTTRSGAKRSELRIRKEDLGDSRHDLETIDLPLHTSECGPDEHGTSITLSDLNQAFAFPSAERLRELLVLEYGREAGFEVRVNGEPLAVEDVPGETFTQSVDLPALGKVRLQFTIADGKKPLRAKHSGVAIRVNGKVVGRPVHFGLEEDEEIPPKLLNRIYGEVHADGLSEDVTVDWGAVIENSTRFRELQFWVKDRLKERVRKTFSSEVNLAKARRQAELNRRLAGLPEHRKRLAQVAVERALSKFYGETEERKDTVINVMLDAFERDEYWVVVQAIEGARHSGVAIFAEALADFGLVDMALMVQQANRRLEVLERLDELVANPETLEKQMHQVIERNLWVLGSDYALLASNRTLASIVERWAGREFPGDRATRRPDLLLCEDVRLRHVVIEFKRPSHSITRDDENQAVKYSDDLRHAFENIEILVIGGRRDSSVDPRRTTDGLRVMSYSALVSTARTQLRWLVEQLAPSAKD